MSLIYYIAVSLLLGNYLTKAEIIDISDLSSLESVVDEEVVTEEVKPTRIQESSESSAEEIIDILQPNDEPPEPYAGCGYSNSNSNSSRANEHDTQFSEYAWMVAIYDKKEFIGAGSLIAPNIVLTAAHIIKDHENRNLRIVAGEWDIEKKNESLPELTRAVSKSFLHEQFWTATLQNNIALLVLNMSYSSQPNIRTICLPSPGMQFDLTACKTTAWQQLKEDNYMPTGILQQTDFAMLSKSACSQRLPLTYLNAEKQLDERHLCALNNDQIDSCVSNGGEALLCPMQAAPNRYVQAGILIAGIRCGHGEKYPALFVNTAEFMPWIFSKLGPLNIDLNYYQA
ncbi:maker557 [Drosophila busckii]|uniref:Maker557 n=1 Tax=Drosophila busckii TaxID=30019 RepID=A0A0M4EBE8_DROBS|nr:maker557 [Drosophila busckii]